jgi:hypothetical protein
MFKLNLAPIHAHKQKRKIAEKTFKLPTVHYFILRFTRILALKDKCFEFPI